MPHWATPTARQLDAPTERGAAPVAYALTYIDTGSPHWANALLFVLAAAAAISLTWWFFGSGE